MMIDYSVRDDWTFEVPSWIRALTSSFDRRHGGTLVLPLSSVVAEIIDWVDLASGEEAWDRRANRDSLSADLEQSVTALGDNLRASLGPSIDDFRAALAALSSSKTAVKEAPGQRSNPLWEVLRTAGAKLLEEVSADTSVSANWADLVATVQDSAAVAREYRPIADLLFEQGRLRGHDPDRQFSRARDAVAYGRGPGDGPLTENYIAPEERVALAEVVLLEPPLTGHVVVWLGYQGGTINHTVEAGDVTFMWAAWHVPNAQPGRQDFPHKAELMEIVGHLSMFRQPELVGGEPADSDILVRVDLGQTIVARAIERAEDVVKALIDLSLHNGGGVRPVLAEAAALIDGELGPASFLHTNEVVRDDHYGMNIIAEAIEKHAPRLGEAMTRSPLPKFISAALEAQTAADLPYSRERMLRRAGDEDLRFVVPLQDRVVQHVAAYAGTKPADLFQLLERRVSNARWAHDVDRAARMCMLGGGPEYERVQILQRDYRSFPTTRDYWSFISGNRHELLAVCRVESERPWIELMLDSVSDKQKYEQLLGRYKEGFSVLAQRRTRVRNALVHGNPVEFLALRSVATLASYFSDYALKSALTAFIEGRPLNDVLDNHLAQVSATEEAVSIAEYWEAQNSWAPSQ